MSKISTEVLMELKGLRIYKLQIFISLFLIPCSYALIILLSGGMERESLAYLFSGLVVASLVGSFMSLLSLRVSNLTQPQVLELYATLPISIPQVVLGLVITYTLLACPQIAFFLGLTFWLVDELQLLPVIIGVFISNIALISMSVFMGVVIRNPFRVQGLFPLLSWILLLISPIYYQAQHLPDFYTAILLMNPVTHALNVIRPFLGFSEVLDLGWSFLYLVFMSVALSSYSFRAVRSLRILEKLF